MNGSLHLRSGRHPRLATASPTVVVLSLAACGGSATTASPSASLASPTPATSIPSAAAAESVAPAAEISALVVKATIPGFYGTANILATSSAIWVLDHSDASLARIDPKTNTVSATISFGGGNANGLGLAGGRLWTFHQTAGEILGIDPTSAKIVVRVKLGQDGDWFTVGDGSAWLVTGGKVARIDPATGAVTSLPLDAACSLDGFAAGGGFLWMASASGDLCKVDEKTGAVVDRGTGLGTGGGFAIVGGRPWLATADGGVSIVDPATLTAVTTVPGPPPGTYQGITRYIGQPKEGSVVVGDPDGEGGWVRNLLDTVGRVTLGATPTIRLYGGFPHGTLPAGVVKAFGSLWVANGDQVTRYALPMP